MSLQAGSVIILLAFLSVTAACGGGASKSAEEPESATEEATPSTPQVSTSPKTTKPASSEPISKGEGTDVSVSKSETLPSLTLFNVGNAKLNWNDVGVAGTVYSIFKRPKEGSYDETPWQTLNDIASFTLPEAPGNWCYKVQALLPTSKSVVQSNEVCITGPALLLVEDMAALNLPATQNFAITWNATGGSESARFACIASCPTGLAISASGALSWTPTLAQMGPYTPKFRITSGSQSLEKTLTLTVTEAPLQFAAPTTASTVATQLFQYPLAANAHGLSIQYSCAKACPTGLSVDASTGLVSWTPSYDQVGSFAVTVQAKTAAQTQTQILQLTVTEAPLHFNDPVAQHLKALETLSFNLQADAHGAAVSYACAENCVPGLSVHASSGLVSWTPQITQVGTFAVVVSAHALTQTVQKTLQITVAEAPLTFTAPAATQLVATNSLHMNLQAAAGGHGIQYSCQAACPQGMTVDASTGALDWTPAYDQAGTYSITLQAKTAAQTRTQILQLTVTEAPLRFTDPVAQNLKALETLSLTLQADAHGAPVSYACAENCVPGLTVDASSGLVSWTPQITQVGTFAVVLSAHALTQTVQKTLQITVEEAPLSFTAPAATQLVATNSLHLNLQASASGHDIQYSCQTACPQGLVVDASTGALDWTPAYDQAGTYSITLQAKTAAQTRTQILQLTVTEALLQFTDPVAQNLKALETLSLTLQADAHGAAVSYACAENCLPGLTVDASSGLVSWTPQITQVGTFAVVVSAHALTQTLQKTLQITVAEAPLIFTALAPTQVVATNSLHLNLQATAGGHVIQYSCTNACPQGLVVDAATGALDWTPAYDKAGSYAVTLQAKTAAQTRTQVLQLTVTEATLQFTDPVAQSLKALETLSLTLQADAHGAPVSYVCAQNCVPGLTVDASSGLVSWTPRITQVGTFAVVVSAHALTQTVQKTLQITVDEAPLIFTALAPTQVVATNSLHLNLQATAGGHAIQYSCKTGCPQGLAVDAATGALDWTPAYDKAGSYAVTLQAKTAAQTRTQVLQLTVTEAPLQFTDPVAQNLKALETLSLTLQADAHGAPVSYACAENCVPGLTIHPSSGAVSWTPQITQVGTFAVVVSAHALTQTVQKTLQITVDEAPLSFTAPAATQLVATNSLHLNLQASAGGHGIQYSCETACPQGLVVDVNTGAVDWTPAYSQAGTYNITLQARTAAQTQTQVLRLTVTEAPLQFTAPTAQLVKANGTLSFALQADAHGAPVTFSCDASCPANFTVSSAGLVSWTPNINQIGAYAITLRAHALTQNVQQSLHITVDEASLNFPVPAAVQVVATAALHTVLQAEAGGHALQYACLSACPPGLTVDASTGAVDWTPTYNQAGNYVVVVQAQTAAQSVSRTLAIVVSEYPLQWTSPAAQRVTANQNLTLNLQADAHGAPITYSCLTSCPQGLSVSAAGVLSWTPQYFQSGSFTVTLAARALTQTVPQNLSITVDEAPLHFTAPGTVRAVATENIQLNLQADAGGQTIRYACAAACPTGLAVNASSGVVSWTPTVQQVADFSVVLSAQAGSQTLQQTLVIQVVEAFINLSLQSSSDLLGEHAIAFTAQPNTNLSGAKSYAVQQTAGPAVTLQKSGSTWTFTAPNVRQPTDFQFTVTATIGSLSRAENITLRVLPNDHVPTFVAFAPQTTVASENFQLQAVAADVDGDALSFACILDCPSGFSIQADTGLITWLPLANQLGSFTPTLQVTANGRTATQTLSLIVQTPSMTLSSNSISGISGATVTIRVNVQSNLHGPFQYSISQSTGPVVTLNGSAGTWTFTVPSLNFPANVGFDVIVGNGVYSKLQNFTGRLDPQPIAPTVDVGPDLIKNQSFSVSAVASPNSQTLAWSKVSGPGTLSFGQPSAATTSISASAEGTYVIRLTATNSWGQTGSDDLTLVWDTTPPTVNVGADASTRTAYTRAATVSGANTLAWSKTSGPGPLTFSASSSASTVIDAQVDGDYVVRLTATDIAGNSAFAEFTLRFDKTPPGVDVGPAIVTNLADVSLFAAVSNDVDTLLWTKQSGPGAVNFANPDQDDTLASFAVDGVYGLRLTATDGFGNIGFADLAVTIDRQAPVIGSIALGSAVADGYLNLDEHSNANPLIATPTATDLTAVTLAYKLVLNTVTCNSALTYVSSIPLTNDVGFTSKGTYKVCVQAKDSFNQSSFAGSANIVYDTGTVTVVISNLPPSISSSNLLQATAGGTSVTHYKFKVGTAAGTICSDASGYSEEQDVSSTVSSDLTGLPDGAVRLCAIGRNISGNWQPTSTAYQYNWTLDRAAPDQPQNLTITSLTQRIKFNWTKDASAAGYLIVRAPAGVISWQPTAGMSYAVGQTIDSNLTVVSTGLTLPTFDNTPQAGTTYQYAVFGYDSAFNYSPSAQGSATAQASLAYNVADGFDRTVRAIVPARDGSGKYYAAGDFLIYGSRVASRLIRLNADMTPDTSFNAPAFNNVIYAIAAATDGRVYVGGTFTASTGITHVRLLRLNNDGSVDANFNVGTTGFNSTVQTLALDETLNRLYVGGAFTTYKSAAAARIVALKTDDASIDTSFNCGTCISAPSTATVYAMNVLPGQGLYLGGTFTVLNDLTLNRIARMTAAGAVDTSFATSTGTIGFDSTVYALDRDSSGYLYVGGAFAKYRGSANAYRLTRLSPSNGAIDASWPITNKFNGTVYTMRMDPEGSIYIGGDFTAFGSTTTNRLAHLSASGVLDTSFPAVGGVMNGIAANGGFPVLTLQVNSSEVMIGGSFQRYGTDNVAYFVRTNRSGVVMNGTPRGTLFNSSVYALAKTNTPGQYLMGGYFTTFKGTTAYRVAKVNKSGVIDTSLASAITTSSSYVYALGYDTTTNKFYAGGTFTAPSGRLARFNSDGTADTTFNNVITTTGFNSDVYAIAPDPGTGGVYVGGKFTTLKTSSMTAAATVNYLVRLLPSGSLDTSFNTGTAFNGQVNAIQVMDDGTVVVVGAFTTYNGTTVNRLIRLNADGSPNNGFDIGAGFNGAVQAIQYVKNEHALYVGGAFTTFRGVTANRLAKLDEAGLASSGWSISTGLSSTVYALSWDSDQEVLWVGGNFSTVRGITSPRIAGVNRDGTLHAAFNPGSVSLNGDVRALQADAWGLIFGGTGSTYQNKVMDYIGRFLFNGTLL